MGRSGICFCLRKRGTCERVVGYRAQCFGKKWLNPDSWGRRTAQVDVVTRERDYCVMLATSQLGSGFNPEVSGHCASYHVLFKWRMKGRVRVAKIVESTEEPSGNMAGANCCRRYRIPMHLWLGRWCLSSVLHCKCHHAIFVGMRMPWGVLKKELRLSLRGPKFPQYFSAVGVSAVYRSLHKASSFFQFSQGSKKILTRGGNALVTQSISQGAIKKETF